MVRDVRALHNPAIRQHYVALYELRPAIALDSLELFRLEEQVSGQPTDDAIGVRRLARHIRR